MKSVLLVAAVLVALALWKSSTTASYKVTEPTFSTGPFGDLGPVDAQCPNGTSFDPSLKQCAIKGNDEYINPICPPRTMLVQNRSGLSDSCISTQRLKTL